MKSIKLALCIAGVAMVTMIGAKGVSAGLADMPGTKTCPVISYTVKGNEVAYEVSMPDGSIQIYVGDNKIGKRNVRFATNGSNKYEEWNIIQ